MIIDNLQKGRNYFFMLFLILGLVVVLLILLAICYKKVGPHEVMFITGAFLGGKIKVVKGGGAFVIPIFQQVEVQPLDTFNINVSVENFMTATKVPIDVQATALLRVGSSEDMLATAAEKILGLTEDERDQQLVEIVRGGVREILSTLTPTQANDRSSFQEAVVKIVSQTFANLGLEITKLTITSISDKNGYFKSLYTKDVEDKKADARVATAEADKRASLVEAQNLQEKEAARLEAEKQVAANQRDTDVAKAQYQAEVNKQNAVAEKAGDIASAEQQAIVEAKNAAVNEEKAKATTIVKAHADAEQMEIMANANSKKRQIDADADAKQVKIQTDAEAAKRRQLAEADAYTVKQSGDAESEKITKIGQANANAQKAMQEALNSKQGQAAMQMAIIKMLPQLVKNSADAIAHANNLTIFNGAEGTGQMSNQAFAQTMKFVKDSTGLDIVENLNKQANGQRVIDGRVPVSDDHVTGSKKS